MYRDLVEFAPRLAQFYLTVNSQRIDKLKEFNEYASKINDTSFVFLFAIGGDEASKSGTSFLVSFLNVGRRIDSSYENFLLFGANVKENGEVVCRYLKKLLSDVKYLETQVFKVLIGTDEVNVEFRLEGLPNDMKFLAFLCGELTNRIISVVSLM